MFKAKAAIRELLPGGLREAISKVRSSVAYAVSAIAHWDWPEAWPQLFSLLMEMLVSGDVNAVHGAMRVLTGLQYPYALQSSGDLHHLCQPHLCQSRSWKRCPTDPPPTAALKMEVLKVGMA
ncbi:hypothetical protein CRUP_022879 [Coryphaenoides rupestris]|nr:hypothetical protein CRUP_022879 [Coryphaenoides rupestris]